jgi:hypothetical protein
MFTHRVRISVPSEVDRKLAQWLKRAYDAS